MKVETQFILFPVNPAVIHLLLFMSFYILNNSNSKPAVQSAASLRTVAALTLLCCRGRSSTSVEAV